MRPEPQKKILTIHIHSSKLISTPWMKMKIEESFVCLNIPTVDSSFSPGTN